MSALRIISKTTMVVLTIMVFVHAALTGSVYALSTDNATSLGESSELFWPDQTGACATGNATTGAPGTLPSIIPEPYNGAFTSGANKYKVAPALIAGLFTEENFTKTPTTGLAARWQKLPQTQPDPNSGWPTNKYHTEGAFQFIPGTWAAYGVDGNGDGVKDPQNIYDAAASAANYVAHNGATVDKPPASWQNAIYAYNHAQWYVEAVMMYYNFYSAGGTASAATTATTAPPAQATSAQTSCAGGAGSVNCNGSTPSGTAGLSQIRQKVVCIAQGELTYWQPGPPPGGPAQYCKKYINGLGNPGGGSGGSCEEWCADFASWVYFTAGYPLKGASSDSQIGTSNAWRVASVDGIHDVGLQNQSFHFRQPIQGYTPQPGDLVIHKAPGVSHVNIVISVSGQKVTMIGGDQGKGPYGGPNSQSVVSQYTQNSFTDGSTIGYVTPD